MGRVLRRGCGRPGGRARTQLCADPASKKALEANRVLIVRIPTRDQTNIFRLR